MGIWVDFMRFVWGINLIPGMCMSSVQKPDSCRPFVLAGQELISQWIVILPNILDSMTSYNQPPGVRTLLWAKIFSFLVIMNPWKSQEWKRPWNFKTYSLDVNHWDLTIYVTMATHTHPNTWNQLLLQWANHRRQTKNGVKSMHLFCGSGSPTA